MAEVLIAKRAFLTEVNGQRVTIRKGQIIDGSHPVLAGREEMFGPVADLADAGAVKEPESKQEPAEGKRPRRQQ